MQVCFDTNIVGPLASPADYPNHPDASTIASISGLIARGVIDGLVAQSTFGLEALDRQVRIDEFFRAWAGSRGPLSMPKPAPIREAILGAALTLGLRVLHVPRIGLGPFIEIPPTAWAIDSHFGQAMRQSRTSAFIQAFASKGPDSLKQLGAELVRLHQIDTSGIPPISGLPPAEDFFWLDGIVAEYDKPTKFTSPERFSRHLRDLVGEWGDVDALAATYGYGVNLFCTLDRSVNTGIRGLLHPGNSMVLKAQYGITVVTPDELLELCS